MNANVTSRITIQAPPTEVFKYLTHLRYHYLWNPQVRSWSRLGVVKKGSRYSTTSSVLGMEIQANNLITRLQPDKLLSLQNNIGTVKYQVDFRLSHTGQKTLLNCLATLTTDSNLLQFSLPVLRKLAQRELQTDLQALKVAVENKLT